MRQFNSDMDNPCLHTIPATSGKVINAVVCDLDGTLLYPGKGEIGVKGRSGISFLGKDAALLLAKISRVFPLVIATGRNAASTARLVEQLPDVTFSGFVLENGFVVRQNIHDNVGRREKWDEIAALFPHWERLPFYENCAGFIPPKSEREGAEQMARKVLRDKGYDDLVYRENRKIFIYPGTVDKMRGLSILKVHPYIALGDQINDIEMFKASTCPVTPKSGVEELKTIVREKNGFCSLMTSHQAARDMLNFAYKKISNDLT